VVKKQIFVAVACTAALVTLAAAAPASAAAPSISIGKVSTIATNLVGPLSLAVDATSNIYVSQNFAGTLERITPAGKRTTVASAPGMEIGAVSSLGGVVYFSQGNQPTGVFSLMKLVPGGTPTQLADLGAYEAANNPDQVNHYGFTDLTPQCKAEFPPPPSGPPGPETPPQGFYTGVVDTHVYASAATSNAVYVADAGGNDILRVGLDGKVSTVAVLPPTAPVTVSAAMAAGLGFPACSAGHGYAFEFVPTDVEIGPGGWLYVTSLPGGPEDASLGARGSIVKINPATGQIVTVATGLVGATGLAIDNITGTIAVNEMFGGPKGTGQVSVILPNTSKAAASIPVTSPAAIELRNGKVYITHNAAIFGPTGPEPGKLSVVSLSLSGSSRLLNSVG
jgi:hypothetical protein